MYLMGFVSLANGWCRYDKKTHPGPPVVVLEILFQKDLERSIILQLARCLHERVVAARRTESLFHIRSYLVASVASQHECFDPSNDNAVDGIEFQVHLHDHVLSKGVQISISPGSSDDDADNEPASQNPT